MSIRMRAVARCYRNDESREYTAGQHFMVPTEREADRLVRMRKAVRAEPEKQRSMPQPRGTYRTAAITADTPVADLVQPTATVTAPAPVAAVPLEPSVPEAAASASPDSPPVPGVRRNRYRRTDLGAAG